MFREMRNLLAATSVAFAFLISPVLAASPEKSDVALKPVDDSERARALLGRAVRHMKERGEMGLGAFSRAGEFFDEDLYVYVLGIDGKMLSSGGSSSVYIGRDMREYRDSDGKQFFQEMVDGAKANGSGKVEYRWLNREHGKLERKVAYYQLVDNRIVAVGYYVPRATPEQARAILQRAADEIRSSGPAAFARFNDLKGGFVQDDTYVFVVGLKDNIMHAHGAMPRLVGRNVSDLKDPDGMLIIRKMIDIANSKGEGSLDYQWRNPVVGKLEKKRAFIKRVGDYMVAVGHYQP